MLYKVALTFDCVDGVIHPKKLEKMGKFVFISKFDYVEINSCY